MNKSFAALALLSLGACAKPYVGTPYAAPATPVTSVGIVADTLPKDAVAFEAASTMSNFGLIGALVDAGVQASRKDRVNDALESIQHDPETVFEKHLVETLAANRVSATLMDGPDREERKFLASYPAAPAGTQALVDFNVTSFGYVNAGNQLWRPVVTADARMVDALNGKTIMENRIVYNGVNTQAGVVTIAPNPAYTFQNREDMVANPERLAAGIDDALKQVAETAVRLMK